MLRVNNRIQFNGHDGKHRVENGAHVIDPCVEKRIERGLAFIQDKIGDEVSTGEFIAKFARLHRSYNRNHVSYMIERLIALGCLSRPYGDDRLRVLVRAIVVHATWKKSVREFQARKNGKRVAA